MKKTMKRLMLFFLPVLLLPPAMAQEAGIRERLQQQIEAVEAERDAVQRRLLDMEARTGPLVEQLTREQQRLHEELDQTRRRLLRLESAGGITESALRRAETELQQKAETVAALEAAQRADQQAFAEQLNQLQQTEADRTGALTEELEALRERMQARETELAAARSARELLQQERGDIQALNQQLEQDLTQARRDASLSQAQISALTNRLARMESELESAFQERSQAQEEARRLQERVAELESAIEQARAESAPAAEVERLQQALGLVNAENQFLREELERLQSLPDLREPLARSERERDLLDAQVKTLQTRLQEAHAALTEEQQRRSGIEQANLSLQAQLAELATSRDALQLSRQELEQELQRLQQESAQLDQQSREALTREQQRRTEVELANRSLLDRLIESETHRGELQQQLERQESEMGDSQRNFQQQLAQLQQENARRGIQLEELQHVAEAASALQEDRQRLMDQLMTKTGEVDVLMEALEQVRRDHGREMADLQTMLGAAMQDFQRAQRRLDDMERRGISSTQLAELDAERARMQSTLDQSRRDLRTLASYIHTLRREAAAREQRELQILSERQQLLNRIRELEGMRPVRP